MSHILCDFAFAMRKIYKYALYIGFIVVACQITACNAISNFTFLTSSTPSAPHTAPATLTPSITPTLTPSLTATHTKTPTKTTISTATATSTVSLTPSITPTPTISPTPTIDFPDVTVNVANAHCRYGPGSAYLHAADLFENDHGLVWNRNYAGTWLWVRFDKLNYACWVASSVTEIDGDAFSISAYSPPLPKSTLYGPPKNVAASRNRDQVVVTWEEVWMTEDDDRGYLIEARVCQNGYLIDMAVHTDGMSYTFLDENSCDGESKGRLYAVEKHGYTDPVQIPWP